MIIFIAEEDKELREQLLKYARKYFLQAEIYNFQDGVEALTYAKTHVPNIIIADTKMSQMHGMIFSKKIREKHPKCNVILITDTPEYAGEAMRLHVSGYVIKPLTEEKFVEEIKNLRYVEA